MINYSVLSNRYIKEIKNELFQDNLNLALDFLRNTQNIEILKIFKEQKLLLIPKTNYSTLIEEYRCCIKRLLNNNKGLTEEIYYIEFISHYRIVTSKLQQELNKLIEPFLNRNLKEFIWHLDVLISKHFKEEAERFVKQLSLDKDEIIPIEEIVKYQEVEHDDFRGKTNDVLFAITNLINYFSRWQSKHSRIDFVGVKSDEEISNLYKAITISSNLNSYLYALDNLSYGEWKINQIFIKDSKPQFNFSIIDNTLSKSREFGLRRLTIENIRKKKNSWLRYLFEEVVWLAYDRAWQFYGGIKKIALTTKQDYDKGKKELDDLLCDLCEEDELLVGLNREKVEIVSVYINSFVLAAFVIAANCHKIKSREQDYDYSCPRIPIKIIEDILSEFLVEGKEIKNYLESFISKLPVNSHYSLFQSPYLLTKNGDIHSVDKLIYHSVKTSPKSILMKGGHIANVIGKAWENYIAFTFKEYGWDYIQSIKLNKKDGSQITDIDLLVNKGDLVLVIQIKVYYGNGVNTYEQWKFKNKIFKASSQASISVKEIEKRGETFFAKYLNSKEIKTIQPLIMTNTHFFNGWNCNGVPVLSLGGLMQILNGATVKYETNNNEQIGEKKYGSNKNLSSEEILSFINKPLDWRIGNPKFEIKYHTEKLDYGTLNFPRFVEKLNL